MFKKCIFLTILILSGCTQSKSNKDRPNMDIKQKIAQKIMLDLRYYCPDMKKENQDEIIPLENQVEGYQTNGMLEQDKNNCKTPLTKLPKELAEMIKTTSLGGVILFADNLVDPSQIIQLTSDLQNAALQSNAGLPLFISVDQEGGRVVRLPRNMSTSFTGNMAIGATYASYGTLYAKSVGEILGNELKTLGFNVDHAPVVDVNVNPDNPVINTRSFGEDPKIVARLGIAMLNGLQAEGIIGTLKHFPGHGDTNVDSHTGLPRVDHDINTVKNVDLYPFQQAINNTNVEMIMTAHIQYPALDNTVIVNKEGQSMIKPATLSKKILTNLLRDKMGYKGLVITDALDMAGISHFFTPLEAVFNTFKAGADIALMPMKIRKPADIQQFKNFINQLSDQIKNDHLAMQQVKASMPRILNVKHSLSRKILLPKDIKAKVLTVNNILANKAHRKIESIIAERSIVEIKNNLISTDWMKKINKIHLLFPQQQQGEAMALALNHQFSSLGKTSKKISISDLTDYNVSTLHQQIDDSNLLIVASDSQKTAVEMGGVEDLSQHTFVDNGSFGDKTLQALKYAKKHKIKTLFISLKAPYHLQNLKPYADCILASFNGDFYEDKQNEEVGPVFSALASIISGAVVAQGNLPISIR